MSKKANSFLIGIFVLVSCALFLAGLVLFGSGKFFRKETNAILFFDDSVKGLKVGGSVTFRGVKIGEVTDMQVQLNRETGLTLIPVVITIFNDKITALDTSEIVDGKALELLIKNGLRAQLQMESIVTGILAINLDFFPEKPPRYIGAMPKYREIPTVPSTLEELSKTLERLPLQKIATGIDTVVTRLGELLESEDAGTISKSLTETMQELRATLESFTKLSNHLDQQVDPISKEVLTTLQGIQESLSHVNSAVTSASGMFQDGSEGRYELGRLLVSLQNAADQVRALAEFIERNPESLLYGKKK